eukprot:12937527-Prorocentrum_lima.AAC.1
MVSHLVKGLFPVQEYKHSICGCHLALVHHAAHNLQSFPSTPLPSKSILGGLQMWINHGRQAKLKHGDYPSFEDLCRHVEVCPPVIEQGQDRSHLWFLQFFEELDGYPIRAG